MIYRAKRLHSLMCPDREPAFRYVWNSLYLVFYLTFYMALNINCFMGHPFVNSHVSVICYQSIITRS